LALLADRSVSPVSAMFFPHGADLAAREDHSGLREALTAGTRISLAVAGPLTLTLGILAVPGIHVWVGSEFAGAARVVVYLAAAAAIKALTRTGIQMLHGMGDAKIPAILFSGEAVLNLTLSVILGRRMGLVGVAIGTLIAAAAIELFVLLPYMTRRIGVSLGGFLRHAVLPHLPAVVLASAAGWLITRADLTRLPGLAGAAVVIVAVYGITFWFSGLRPSERARVLSRLRRSH
jgi:O-antigen/teichoic acid export membrane protein